MGRYSKSEIPPISKLEQSWLREARAYTDTYIPQPQPKKCAGCIWGHHDGRKQYCSLPRCIKAQG